MIYLKEQQPPYKLPGEVSFFVEFDYAKNIVDTMHTIPSAIYHKKLKCWEIPVTSLARAIDSLVNLDKLQVNFLPDWFIKL